MNSGLESELAALGAERVDAAPDLFRVDLGAVVSKYLGETEKNLRRIFALAAEAGGMLLFDDADALFGKRTQVKDSHDRYSNIDPAYFLQLVDEYDAVVVLTTNFKQNIDAAFMRRFRFVNDFPRPVQREPHRESAAPKTGKGKLDPGSSPG